MRVLENGAVASTPFLDIHEQVKSGGEQGLLALAFHPDFPDDPRFYVHYSHLHDEFGRNGLMHSLRRMRSSA